MKNIHFIGIGGIGVSALAKYYLEKGCEISGSDLVSSEITEALEKEGAKVFIGEHKSENLLKDVDLVIHSPAVQENNSELKEAKRLRIKTQSYPQALGELTKEYFTIAVAGTHGKSTVTSMIGILLTEAGLDPTVIVGTRVKEFDGFNCRVGKSKYLIIEACEHEESFLNYSSNIAVITNIEKEHLDYYKNLDNILKAFNGFVSNLSEDGTLVVNSDDENSKKIASKARVQNFSLKQEGAEELEEILKIPGKHNVSNALAALTVARILEVSDEVSFKSLASYKGTWRRFETKESMVPGSDKKILIINDYAHHPTELKATLEATRSKFSEKEIWAVFQPHQYQRTFYLFDDFVKVLSETSVDKLIITDIYDVAGREEKSIKEGVSSQKLAEKVGNKVIYIPSIEKTVDYLKENLRGGEVVLVMGAGDIYKLVDYFPLDRKQVKKRQ